MKNYPKPPLIEMMKSLYYIMKSKHITSFQLTVILIDEYNVNKVEFEDGKMKCYQKDIITSIPI